MINAARVRELREAHGWTQTDLADLAGMTPAAVSEVESGKRQPYPRTGKRLADALGVELAELHDGRPVLPAAAERRADVWDKSGGVCYSCGKTLHPFRDFNVDHVIARCAGGTDDAENLVASCFACNWEKRTELDVPARRRKREDEAMMRYGDQQVRADGLGQQHE